MMVPILKLGDILLTSIQVDLSDEEAEQFQSELLNFIQKNESLGVVLDITALDIVDSFFARVINETATMARILGARVVISGMRPAVALTLVEMGRGLIDVDAALNLEQGLERLRRILNESGLVETSSADLPEWTGAP
jgi:rsbT antagonist protein RsbS